MELKRFEDPSIELLKLDMIDVITTSSGPNDENAGEEDEF